MDNNINSLPLVLSTGDIQSILGIGRVQAYQLVNSEGFPAIRIGKNIRIPRDLFFQWLEKNSKERKRVQII